MTLCVMLRYGRVMITQCMGNDDTVYSKVMILYRYSVNTDNSTKDQFDCWGTISHGSIIQGH